ncbi:MAG: sigma-54-dependent transcriptional regulator [Candidatus Puniceispirillales bacterium WSBS_2018_MAG_OTU23]
MKPEILIVDDEHDIRLIISDILEDEGYSCRMAANAAEARKSLQEHPSALVILDIWMHDSDMDGLELQKWIRKLYPNVPAIMISGHGNIETAVQAMKDGAYDFIEKPFKSDRLLLLIERALQLAAIEAENADLRKQSTISTELVGISPMIENLRQQVEKIADSNSRVLITGPAGSGKELVARSIHANSARRKARFVLANCAMLSPDQLSAELFGTEGVDGRQRIVGLFEQAHGGTLYFDEIGDLPLETQGKLIRAVQNQRFRRLGGTSEVTVDVRVISASSLNLEQEIANGNLREDLFYRLSVVPLSLMQLSDHKEDIPFLVKSFLNHANAGQGAKLNFTDSAMALMQIHDWPGNVRQLRNVIDWLLIMVDKDEVGDDDLPPEITGRTTDKSSPGFEAVVGMPLKAAREAFEKQYLLSQLSRFNGNISKTASFIGMERSALYRKLKSLNINFDLNNHAEED